ncbi:MAG: hypothetical protein Ct9H90mP18_05220 [Gammaproteobacteria bacterium]|nr:MAG: hypothetical protein Ct9H90mP18_05220 [Gammaproteobacteria bacterium]
MCRVHIWKKIIIPYRVLWIIIIPIGAATELNLIWLIADIMNGLMAFLI